MTTYHLTKKARDEEKKLKTIDLTENLIIVYEKLNSLFEKLKDDYNYVNYFSFKNIQQIQNSLTRVKDLNVNVILFPNMIRQDVLEITESSNSLINEIDSLERNPVNNFLELKQKTELFDKEYRELTLELIKQGVYVKNLPNGSYYPALIDEQVTLTPALTKKLEVFEMIRQDLITKNDSKKTELDKVNEESRKKRTTLYTEILTTQKSIKDLIKSLKQLN